MISTALSTWYTSRPWSPALGASSRSRVCTNSSRVLVFSLLPTHRLKRPFLETSRKSSSTWHSATRERCSCCRQLGLTLVGPPVTHELQHMNQTTLLLQECLHFAMELAPQSDSCEAAHSWTRKLFEAWPSRRSGSGSGCHPCFGWSGRASAATELGAATSQPRTCWQSNCGKSWEKLTYYGGIITESIKESIKMENKYLLGGRVRNRFLKAGGVRGMIIITWLQRRGERGNDGGKEEEGPRKIIIMFVLKEGGEGGITIITWLQRRTRRRGPGGVGLLLLFFCKRGAAEGWAYYYYYMVAKKEKEATMAGRRRKGRGGGVVRLLLLFFFKRGGEVGIIIITWLQRRRGRKQRWQERGGRGAAGEGGGMTIIIMFVQEGEGEGWDYYYYMVAKKEEKEATMAGRRRKGRGGGGVRLLLFFFFKGGGRLGLLSLRGWREGGEGSNDGRNEEEEGLQGRGVGWLLLLLRCREGPGGGARGGGGITIIIFCKRGGPKGELIIIITWLLRRRRRQRWREGGGGRAAGGGVVRLLLFFFKRGGRLGLLSLRGCREGGEGSNDGRNEEEEGPQGRGVGWLLLLCLCKRGRAKGGIIIITWLLRRRRRRQRWREGGGRAAGGGL